MNITATCHNHTTLCDGKNTPQEMAEAALAAGFTDLGISGHAYAPEDAAFCIGSEADYIAAIRALRAQYAGRLRIAVGLETDYYARAQNRSAFDYLIASVHMLRCGASGRLYWMDGSPGTLAACRDEMFGGDMMALLRAFYGLTARNVAEQKPDVVGHFDLVTKNNENNAFWDEACPEYRAIVREALDACCAHHPIFEINTGGMFRGYRSAQYPAALILEELCARGARVTLNADAHETAALTYRFEEMQTLLRTIGFRSIALLENGVFVDKTL